MHTKLCAQPFSPISGVFAIFGCNFAKIVAPLGDGNGNSVMHLNGKSILKNGENITKIDQ